jgi:hypothetical protein
MRRQVYGLLAAFEQPEPLLRAAGELRARGFNRLDAFSPYPVPHLAEVFGMKGDRVGCFGLTGGVIGALATYALILYSVEINYPINVGGRPLDSWAPFIVLAFEGGILGAAVGAFFGMLALNRLPAYYHPIFNASSFSFAEGGKFYLLVEATDAKFRRNATHALMQELGASSIEEINR